MGAATQVDSKQPFIRTLSAVLSEAECEAIRQRIESLGPAPAPITTPFGFVMRPDIRNNDRVMFDDVALAAELFERVSSCIPQVLGGWRAVGTNERFRCYRYQPGQYFAPHKDGAFVRSADERSLLTLLVYLNGECEGGETRFPTLGQEVVPARGMGLLFEHRVLHEGAEVRGGVKYVLRTDVMYRFEG
ncbi:putative 2-oxoglutarate/Fe(II)-dependent dioxygenase YbiX [Archangium gephyra]|uniref:2-oxoglutarate/Fe(II)-dependent dioxygenase YbiX n=1 Tax=Archangium gephyra TaxID=48 RepID=A0ABX9KDF9_9BACT|nr:2OG-Fe(II) oxygenase [Archangium gephyra]REG37848.1 putative 2-oxoglutarate/Fe(II)-dependent dioxygenase YbiX [Archangium gephyra]